VVGMKIFNIIALCILTILAFIFVFFGRDFFEMLYAFHYWDKQMKIGKKYMDSLTDKDIQVWIRRSENYLKQDNPKDFNTDVRPVPPDLKQLGIVMIDEDTNLIDYVWMGGMDHTDLYVERMADGSFQVTAEYNDYSNHVIWPRQ
jgi:hypothetical protein